MCILAVYVDDMIITGPSAEWIGAFKQDLARRFSIKDLGECSWILGMAVCRDRAQHIIKLHQSKYIDDMLEKFNMVDAKEVVTPATPGTTAPPTNDNHSELSADTPYQALVGSLLYAAVATRPDISEAVSRLCRAMARPTPWHWDQAKRVLRYLKGTKEHGPCFLGNTKTGTLTGASDADWAGDAERRRSTTGYIFKLCNAAVSWKSQLQTTVALSTAEAEYMALCAAVQEALFLRRMLSEMGFVQREPTVILEDNQSCIALANNNMTHGRSKHIDIRYHFTRECVESGQIVLNYCPTEDMLTDQGTGAHQA